MQKIYSQRYINAKTVLIADFLQCFDKHYFDTTKVGPLGYGGKALFEYIEHLYWTYGKITALDMSEKNLNMRKIYDPSQPISELFKQIGDGQMIAHAGLSPYSVPQLVQIGEAKILQSGTYKVEFNDWNRIPAMGCTFLRFQTYCSDNYAAQNNHLRYTEQAHRYHSGNSATTNAGETEEPQEQFREAGAFVDFLNASAADRSAFEKKSQTNTVMSHQLNDQAQEI